MSRAAYIDWGMNAVPLDPQTLRRDLRGALFLGALGAAAGYAAAWAGLGHYAPTQTTALGFLGDLTAQKLTWSNTSGNLATRGGVSLLTATALGVWLFVEGFKPRTSGIKHVKGRQYLEGQAAIKAAQQTLAAEIQDSAEGVPLSQNFNYSSERETTHTLIVGGVGAGKTTIAHHILRGIFKRNDRVLCVDWKGDFTAAYPGRIFNPLDRRSLRWCVAQDVVSELDAQSFAGNIIPEPAGNGDPFWANAGRSVLTALVIKCQKTKPLTWTWADLFNEVVAGLPSIQKAVSDYYAHALPNIAEEGKQTQGVISQIVAQFDGIRVLAEAEKDDPEARGFSVRRWLAGHGKGQIILAGSTEYERLCRGYMAAIITSAGAQLLAMKDDRLNRRVWFVCDEFPLIGKVEMIQKLLAVGRSKGARVVLLAQDIAQIRSTYGADFVKTIKSMVGTIIVGRTAGGETAEMVSSQWAGTREIERLNTTTQGNGAASKSWQPHTVPVVHPSELESELGKRGNKIHALLITATHALNLPWTFVAPKPYRDSLEMRECFKGAGKAKALTTDEPLAVVNQPKKEAEKEDGKDAERQGVEHQVHAAIDPTAGALLAGIAALELFTANKTSTPQATPSHQTQRLKNEAEQEAEQEQ